MSTVAVLNQKGGTTKTTTSTNLAACIAARGHSVLIVDLNSDKGSATDWAAAQDGNDVAWNVPVISMGKQLARDLQRKGRGFRTFPGKTHAIFLDQANNVSRHGLPDDPREWSLVGRERGKKKSDEENVACRQCEKCYAVSPAAAGCRALKTIRT